MPPRPKKRTDQPKASNELLDAIKFVGLVAKDVGPIHETHIYIGSNWVTAFNGVIAAGHRITEDICACPHSTLMIQALTRCTEQISFTQIDQVKLSIKSGKFKAIIPCIDPTLLKLAAPDEPIANIDNRFIDGLEIVGTLTNENAQNIYSASIMMNGMSLVSTNAGKIIFEYWHGIDLPPGLALPKAIIEPLVKANKKLIKFGFSLSSVTFYFEDESWIKSQLYSKKWPDVSDVLNRPSTVTPVPVDFWNALDAIAPFASEGMAHFGRDSLASHDNPATGACYEVAGLLPGPIFPIRQLALIKPHATSIDFMAKDCLMFYGNQIRGAIAGVKK